MGPGHSTAEACAHRQGGAAASPRHSTPHCPQVDHGPQTGARVMRYGSSSIMASTAFCPCGIVKSKSLSQMMHGGAHRKAIVVVSQGAQHSTSAKISMRKVRHPRGRQVVLLGCEGPRHPRQSSAALEWRAVFQKCCLPVQVQDQPQSPLRLQAQQKWRVAVAELRECRSPRTRPRPI